VATALTAQGRRTFRVAPVSPAMVMAQVRAALEELEPVRAVKVGLAPDLQLIHKLRRLLPGVPWVVDPVVRSSRGEALSRAAARDFLALAGAEVVLTPNVDEAAWLLGGRREREPGRSAERLVSLGFGAAVVKGGHLRGRPVDVVADAGGTHRLEGRRLPRAPSVRGTGCRFASALAVGLARGEPVPHAAAAAKRAVEAYLADAHFRRSTASTSASTFFSSK
jgi:hydroxymethylpyrimidine/phosphomethylpyrimidine kinase